MWSLLEEGQRSNDLLQSVFGGPEVRLKFKQEARDVHSRVSGQVLPVMGPIHRCLDSNVSSEMVG